MSIHTDLFLNYGQLIEYDSVEPKLLGFLLRRLVWVLMSLRNRKFLWEFTCQDGVTIINSTNWPTSLVV